MIENFSQIVQQKFYSASQGNREFLANKGPAHANAVMSAMIDYTRSYLYIYTGCLSTFVYNANSIKSLADRLEDGKVKIIFDPNEAVSENHNEPSAIKAIQALTGGKKVEIRQLDTQVWEKIKDKIQHFAVSDEKNVRSEESHKEFTASIYLCNKEIAEKKRELFELMWGVSKEKFSIK